MDKRPPFFVGLDIGTTKVVLAGGVKDEFGKLNVLGIGKVHSEGIAHGSVINAIKVQESIKKALDKMINSVKETYGEESVVQVKDVYVGIAGRHISGSQSSYSLIREDSEKPITQEEVNSMIKTQFKNVSPPGQKIIDIIPQNYRLDKKNFIIDPVGCPGSLLEGNYFVVSADILEIRKIFNAVKNVGLNPKGIVLQPIASTLAVADKENLDSDFAILDIGGGTSDLAIFESGMLKHTFVLEMGSVDINMDLMNILKLSKHEAESIKTLYGSALEEKTRKGQIEIVGKRGLKNRYISNVLVSKIIRGRIETILQMINNQLLPYCRDEKHFNGDIYITGGGSKLKNLAQLTQYITGINSNTIGPNDKLSSISNFRDRLYDPSLSTCIGLMLRCMEEHDSNMKRIESFANIEELGLKYATPKPYPKPIDIKERKNILKPINNIIYLIEKKVKTFLDLTPQHDDEKF